MHGGKPPRLLLTVLVNARGGQLPEIVTAASATLPVPLLRAALANIRVVCHAAAAVHALTHFPELLHHLRKRPVEWRTSL